MVGQVDREREIFRHNRRGVWKTERRRREGRAEKRSQVESTVVPVVRWRRAQHNGFGEQPLFGPKHNRRVDQLAIGFRLLLNF